MRPVRRPENWGPCAWQLACAYKDNLEKEIKIRLGPPQRIFIKELIAYVIVLDLLMLLCFSAHSMDPFI